MKPFTHYIADALNKAEEFIDNHFWTIICIILFITFLSSYCTPKA